MLTEPRSSRLRDSSPPESLIERSVAMVGKTLCSNEWIAAACASRSFTVTRFPLFARLERLDASNYPSVVLLDGSADARSLVVSVLGDASPACRRRMILIGWSLDSNHIRQFIRSGIADFLNMPSSAGELSLRIELRAQQCRNDLDCLHPGPTNPAPPAVDGLTRTVFSASSRVRLTEREILLYECLAEYAGAPVSREVLRRCVWGMDRGSDSSSNIVDVYVRYLRVKLARADADVHIVTHRSYGYALHRGAEQESPPPKTHRERRKSLEPRYSEE